MSKMEKRRVASAVLKIFKNFLRAPTLQAGASRKKHAIKNKGVVRFPQASLLSGVT
jgi:hypothetical protein